MFETSPTAHRPMNDQPPSDSHPRHPLGRRAQVLLSSVFGPYAQDDQFGSRSINPMELYHNQVTRFEGPFSLRMFHRSWGLMLLQGNISAPCTLLDFPSRERFAEELRRHRYDVVGIGSITTNLLKVAEMCRLVRQLAPQAQIVVGGHVSNIPDLNERIDADWIVRGEGVQWFRHYLGDDEARAIRHPVAPARLGTRAFGVALRPHAAEVAATLIPSVGCPIGCNFCATSAMFGGKGSAVTFYRTAAELFDIMCQIEQRTGTQSFFVMDENFLLDRRRALRLLELMQRHDKAWILYVFSSANVLASYQMEELVGLGLSWVWMGVEGRNAAYGKLNGVDTRDLVRRLQSNGIRVLGSTIIGLESHTPTNISDAIDDAVAHATDFHQFMLYTPLPGTPLFEQMARQGRLLDETQCPTPDTHGQCRFNYRHPHLPAGSETEWLARAFQRDFAVNGPSLLRAAATSLAGWKKYKNHPDPRIRRRFALEAADLATTFAAAAAAARLYFRREPHLSEKIGRLLADLRSEFGWKARLSAALGGLVVYWKLRREERRLAQGWTYEPPTFYEINEAVLPAERPGATRGQWIEPAPPATTELLSVTTESHSIIEPASQLGRHANITADAEG